MADQVFRIRGEFEIKNIINSINQVEKKLEGIEHPTIETKELITRLNTVKSTFQDLQKRAGEGFKTPKELSKFDNAVEKAGQELRELKTTFSEFSIDPKGLAQTDEEFRELRRQINQTKEAIKNINKGNPIKINYSGFENSGKLTKQITEARKQMNAAIKNGATQEDLADIKDKFVSNSQTGPALAYNAELNKLYDSEIEKLNKLIELLERRKTAEGNLSLRAGAKAEENQTGVRGADVDLSNAIASTDKLAESNHNLEVEMGKVEERNRNVGQFAQRLKYMTSLTSMMFLARRAIRGIYNDIKELDTAFNEISVVTGKTMDEMWSSFSKVNSIAQEYGVTTKGVVDVQNMYYHQGLSDIQVNKLTTETLTLAKIAGLEYSDATNKMTAALNAFNLEAEEATRITDVTAALASSAAADSKEIMNALTKTASISASAGTSLENTEVFLTKMINDAVYTRAA